MDWYKKTDEQYDNFITLMMGGDNENEVQLTEDEWSVVICALSDVIDLVTGNLRLKELKENWKYQEILSEFNNIRAAQCLIDTMTKAFQCEGLQPLYYCDFIPNCPDELVAMGAVTKERLKKAKRKVAKEARINRKIRELENEKNKLMV